LRCQHSRDERRNRGHGWLHSGARHAHGADQTGIHAMSVQTSAARPPDLLWQARTLVWIVLAGEALATVLALAPGVQGGRLAYFGMASFAIQWVFLMALCALYVARHRLERVSPPGIARSGLAALLLSTWFVCGLAWTF